MLAGFRVRKARPGMREAARSAAPWAHSTATGTWFRLHLPRSSARREPQCLHLPWVLLAPGRAPRTGSPSPRAVPGTPPATLAAAGASLLGELGITAPHLAGNSLGGWVTPELAAIRPVASLTPFSPAGLWRRDGYPRLLPPGGDC